MHVKVESWLSAALLGALLGASVLAPDAHAQDAASQLEQSNATSDKDKVRFASSAIDEMRETETYLAQALSAAEKGGDPVEALCVNNKLSAVRALVQVAESANAGMQDALASGDAQRADHEFRKVGVALTKARQFKAEADACSGDDGITPGVTEVEVTNEGLSESDDTERIDDGNTGVGEEPPGSSPFE
jgi:hypothetical protein